MRKRIQLKMLFLDQRDRLSTLYSYSRETLLLIYFERVSSCRSKIITDKFGTVPVCMLQIQQASLGAVFLERTPFGLCWSTSHPHFPCWSILPHRTRTRPGALSDEVWSQALTLCVTFISSPLCLSIIQMLRSALEVLHDGIWGDQTPHFYIREMSSGEFHVESQMFLGQILKVPPFGNFRSVCSQFPCMFTISQHGDLILTNNTFKYLLILCYKLLFNFHNLKTFNLHVFIQFSYCVNGIFLKPVF